MSENSSAKKSLLDRILDAIERAGNKLPDPITMFLGLAIIVTIISAICSAAGVSAVNPADGSTIEVFNLLSLDGIRYLWTNVITNFSGFAPLGMVLVAVIGSSVAEKSGFLVAVMVNFLGKAKGWIVTMVIMFLGINLNIAGDAGFIVLPPLAAILYMSIGRHPLLGMYTAFASVAAGFCANILLGLSDALAYGFTEQAAQMIDPNYQQSIAINWYFLIVSCVLLTIVGTILVEKVLLHRFPVSKEELAKYDFDEDNSNITPIQKKGIAAAGLSILIYAAIIVFMCLPIFGGRAILADENGSITSGASPFSKGIVFTVTLFLMIPGIVYGIVIGKYKSDKRRLGRYQSGLCRDGKLYIHVLLHLHLYKLFLRIKTRNCPCNQGSKPFKHDRIYRNPTASWPDLPVLYRQHLYWICFRKMGDPCAGIHSDDDVNGLRPGDHTGRLPYRRFHHKPAVSVIYIPSGHSGLCSQV